MQSIGPPPSIPPVLKRQTTAERAEDCDLIWDEYKIGKKKKKFRFF